MTALPLPRLEDLLDAELAYRGIRGDQLDRGVDSAGASGDNRPLSLLRSPLTVSAALFAAVLGLRLSAPTPQAAGILLLLIGPIVLMSVAYGPRAGAAVATASLAAYAASQNMDGFLGGLGTATRAVAYYAIPLTIWLARRDTERQDANPRPEPPGRGRQEPQAPHLTPRELEVLGLVAAGHTNAEIAEMLVLSVRTVESHRASLRRKLGRPSRSELIAHAQSWGVLRGEGDSRLRGRGSRPQGRGPRDGLLNWWVQ